MIDPADTAVLRSRLVALRDDALRQLIEGEHLDAGSLRLFNDAVAALAALDADANVAAESAVTSPNLRHGGEC